jgi:PAS domain S-box-containing protein
MAEASSRTRILLVEDDAAIALAERRFLSGSGYEVELARDGEEAVAKALSSRFDLILMDLDLGPGIDGGEAARRIRSGGGPPVVFLSSHSEDAAVAKTRDSGGYGFIVKGSGERVLLASVKMALGLAAALRRLAESDRRYRLLAENVGDVIWTLDPRTMRFTYISPSIAALRGMSVEEAMAESLESSMSEESLARVRSSMARLAERVAKADPDARLAVTGLYEQPCKDGSMKWVEITTKPVFDEAGEVVEITGVSRDATARVLAEAALKAALAEKDRLYAELQHRVKNSLALIVSLLSLEAGTLEDDERRVPLEEAEARVRSIGLLYEQLYRTKSVEDIDLGAYLTEVARAAMNSPLGRRGLLLDCECASFRIATDRAVAAGLLLYEIAANAVKHAFPDGRAGAMKLELRLEGGEVSLAFSDDGRGLPAGFDLEAGSGLGSLLILRLAGQLGGSIESGPGTGGRGSRFIAHFPLVLR